MRRQPDPYPFSPSAPTCYGSVRWRFFPHQPAATSIQPAKRESKSLFRYGLTSKPFDISTCTQILAIFAKTSSLRTAGVTQGLRSPFRKFQTLAL